MPADDDHLQETQPNLKASTHTFLRLLPTPDDLKSDKTIQLMFSKARDAKQDSRWQIILTASEGDHPPLALEVYGDVVFGATRDHADEVDINLIKWGGKEKGVSRRHVLLRPTPTALYIIDLDSTNGTFVNGMALGTNQAKPVEDGDLITLGKLSFRIKIIKAQESRGEK